MTGDGECLGVRDPPNGPYKFIKYSEVRTRTHVCLMVLLLSFVRLKRDSQHLGLVLSSWESSQDKKALWEFIQRIVLRYDL